MHGKSSMTKAQTEKSRRARITRGVIGTVIFTALAGLIVWVMVDRLWGEPLLGTVGSRHTPRWLSWIVLSVLLVVTLTFLRICVRNVSRARRDRTRRVKA